MRLASRCQEGYIPSWKFWKRIIFWLFYLLEPPTILGSQDPSKASNVASVSLFLLSHLSEHSQKTITAFKDCCDYTGPTQIILDNLISTCITIIQSAQFLLPHKVTYPQNLGIMAWTQPLKYTLTRMLNSMKHNRYISPPFHRHIYNIQKCFYLLMKTMRINNKLGYYYRLYSRKNQL